MLKRYVVKVNDKVVGEIKTIITTLYFLEHGKYGERKQYMMDYYHDGVFLNGFSFQKDGLAWYIWKPTNIFDNPEFKGEPLVKIIPCHIRSKNMQAIVLAAQSWLYL